MLASRPGLTSTSGTLPISTQQPQGATGAAGPRRTTTATQPTAPHTLEPLGRVRPSAVGNYLALGLLVGNIEVGAFDQAVSALIDVADDELEVELLQIKLLAKRAL